MDVDTIEVIRVRRKRARRLQLIAMAAAIAGMCVVLLVVPRRSQLVGVAVFAMSGALILSSLAVNRQDERHRRGALQAVAVAFVAAVGLQIVDAVRSAIDRTYHGRSGTALAAISAVWIIADFVLRQREDDPVDEPV